MQLWTTTELMHMTRDEPWNLAGTIEGALADLEVGTSARLNALPTLDNIRRVMVWRGFQF